MQISPKKVRDFEGQIPIANDSIIVQVIQILPAVQPVEDFFDERVGASLALFPRPYIDCRRE